MLKPIYMQHMRTAVLLAGSLSATGAVLYHAFSTKHQYYPAMAYIAQSSIALMVSARVGHER